MNIVEVPGQNQSYIITHIAEIFVNIFHFQFVSGQGLHSVECAE